ncbi:MAG: hypothetical protein H6852_03460 [Geminicoccaceae bacterium]|nr:hypothetical protein [Geminicoccaceae bacterium]MCB9966683.1 hypothetical protein [Geminicoccaceae bacterium]HRY26382.1 hypothetical protein [Geminicoccaceae bacterium]
MRTRVESCCIASREEAAMAMPLGADLCSGVGRDGRLDKSLRHRFMTAIQQADREGCQA